MKLIAFCAFLLTSLAIPLPGQSAADLAQRFKRHDVYEVEPGIALSAKFTNAGLVCEMSVEQSHFNGDAIDFTDGIEEAKAKATLDRIVPASERGDKLGNGFITVKGHVMQQVDEYENVTVLRASNIVLEKKNEIQTGETVLQVRWKNRTCN